MPLVSASDRVARGVGLLQLQPDAGTTEVGAQRAAYRLWHAIEEQPFDAHMIVKIFDGAEPRDGHAGMQVQRRSAVCRERNAVGVGQCGGAQEAREPCAARRVGLQRIDRARDEVPIYGSGGFTSYPVERLQAQLGGWARQGIPRVKLKIGTHPEQDVARVRAAREAVGPQTELYVDANGAYTRTQALAQAARFADLGVVWFEEPVSSDDLDGLRFIRDRAPTGMAIAAGEYGYDLWYFRRMLEAGAVDVQQADGSRCGGITGFLRAGTLVEARSLSLSAHCAPSLHLHACCAVPNLWPIEYFHDHVRIERMLFDGAVSPVDGLLHPDLTRPGIGLDFKRKDAEQFAV